MTMRFFLPNALNDIYLRKLNYISDLDDTYFIYIYNIVHGKWKAVKPVLVDLVFVDLVT